MLEQLVAWGPRWHYLAAMAFCIVGTLPLEFVFHARVYARWRRALTSILLGSAPFIVWDYLAIRADNWEFSADHTIGVMLGVFPLEELLFFVVIPLCGLLTYQAVGTIVGDRRDDGQSATDAEGGVSSTAEDAAP